MKSLWMVVSCCALIACGDDGGSGTEPSVSKDIGADGGTVTLANGPTLTVPAGSLASTMTITITEVGPMPGAMTAQYRFEPDGLVFATPATVSFPLASAGASARVFWSKAAPAVGYDELTTTPSASDVSAQVTHFSNGFVAPMGMAFPVGDRHTYAMSSVLLPTTNTQAREYGLDLDADQAVDNQLGMVFSTLGSMGFDLQAETTTAVGNGTIVVLVDLVTTDFTAGPSAGVRTLLGQKTGSAYAVSSMSPNHPYLVGNTVNGTLLTTSKGQAVIQMGFDSTRALTLNLIGARAKVTGASASGIPTGVLAGALTQAEIDATLIPEFAMSAQLAVMRDCTMLSSPPGCGCMADSTGKTWLGLFDTAPQDCSVSTTEVKNNSLIRSLFAPDVVIDGQQALSVGFGFVAASAAFMP